MNCYATLFVNWLISDDGYFEQLLKKRLWPEIGLQHGGFDLPLKGHRAVAARIREAGLRCAVHLPFYGVRTGSTDQGHQRKSRDILLRALDIAAIYEPDHLIGHPEFRPGLDSTNHPGHSEQLLPGGLNTPSPQWLEASARAWAEVLAHSPARLYLENTSDQYPNSLMELLKMLPDRAGLCFDLGHWYYAAEGSVRRNLPQWVEAIAPRLRHLHLHDNDGGSDQHRGIGLGGIDFSLLIKLLALYCLKPAFTLEAHRLADLAQSLAWLSQLPPDAPLAGLTCSKKTRPDTAETS